MMVGSHILTGAVLYAATYGLVGTNGLPDPYIALAAAGAVLPDIDHPQSWLGRRIPFISWPLSSVFGHRTITHGVLGAIIVGVIALYAWGGKAGAAIYIGYVSHLAADFLTAGGVPLYYPLSKAKYGYPLFQVGSLAETGYAMWMIVSLGAMWILKL